MTTTKDIDFERGTALAYRQLLLMIARRENDLVAIVAHARALWLSFHAQEYYEMMVEAVPRDEWPAFRTLLLSDNDCSRELAAWALAHDGLWPEVRDIVFANPSLLAPYQLEIEARFPDETARAYEQFARKVLKDASNRQTYQAAASYLVRMQRVGRGDEGKALARALIEQYPKRRVMIEELRRAL